MKIEKRPNRVLKHSSLGILLLGVFLTFIDSARAEHQLAPERRRPLSRIRSWLRGTDLTIRGIRTAQGTMSASCQSTPVAKKELESPEGTCRLGFITAAHCVDSPFNSISFLGIGEVPKSKMSISIPREYSQQQSPQSREPHGGDSATIVFDIPCEKAESVIPIPLAGVDSNGVTVISSRQVYLQKRQEETTGNRGQGAQIAADIIGVEGPMFRFYAPSPQGYAIVGGDSGGPIFNDKGELICPISGSEYEAKRENNQLTRLPDGTPDKLLDPFSVVCDKRAIGRLRSDLAKFGLAPVSVADAQELSQNSQRQNIPSPQDEDCANGVCQKPQSGAKGLPSHNDSLPGISKRPQETPNNQAEEIPNRTSGGLREVGPVPGAQLKNVFEDAKKKGFKHIVVRYGNDARCKYCRILAGELRSLFGSDSDVLVIKVEDTVIDTRQGIPQSELLSLDENGQWKKQGETQFGAGAGALYKQRVNALRAQVQTPKPQPQAQPFSQGSSPSPQGTYNGYQFEPVQNKTGLHYRRSTDENSEPTGIFLKRMPDGSRRAAKRETDGSLSFLSKDAEDGLRQYYRAHQDKVSKLSDKHQKYISEFLQSPSSEAPKAAPKEAPKTPRQIPSIDHGGKKSASRSPSQTNNGNFRNALPQSAGTVPAHQSPSPDLEKTFPREVKDEKQSPLLSAIGRCMDCHTADSGRKLILPSNPGEALKSLAKQLTKNGPINPEMIVKMAESAVHGALSEEEKKALYQHLFGTTDLKEVAKLDEPSEIPPQEIDSAQLANLKQSLPGTTNPFLDSILSSPSTRFYTDKERPAVYQVDKDTLGAGEGIKFRDNAENVGRLGWRDLFRQSVDTAKVFFKGLLGSPAGLHNTSDADYKTIKFVRNPVAGDKMTPTDVSEIPSGIDSHKIDWKFPEGTVVGEIILVPDPTTGKDRVLQIRTRTKTGENSWQPDIYQAFPTAQSFLDRIKTVYSDEAWKKDPELKRMVEHLEKSSKLPTRSVSSDYAIPVFSGSGGVDELPPLAPDKVAKLLNGAPLDSSLNKRWRTDGQTDSFAPTTKSQFHIVPKNYEAHTLEVSEASCMRCHQNAGTNFGVINPHAKRNDGAPFAPPDAYGSIYGRDGIFTWHPFSSDRFAYQNFGNGVQGAKTDNRYDQNGRLMLQRGWLRSGLIQLLTPRRR